jgi:HlyD family secretion protein
VKWLLAIVLVGCAHKANDASFVDVRRDDLVVGVDVEGELQAVDSLNLLPPALPGIWEFKIANMAPEGIEVKAGDPIMAFDPSEQIRDLENMRNEADSADKKLRKKRDDAALARRDDELKIAEAEAGLRKASLKTDAPSDLVASIDLKQVILDEQAAKLTLESAKNHAAQTARSDGAEIQRLSDRATYTKHRLEQLQQNVARMGVTSPRAGTIVYPMGFSGEKHKVGDSVWRMETVMQIVGLGKMVGEGKVDEVDIARVTDKQHVTLRLDAMPDVQLTGTVDSIAHSVDGKSQTDPSKVAKLKITIDSTTVPLRPGMRFRGQVETMRLAKVIQVPADAVFVTADGPIAYRDSGHGMERVKIEVGNRTATAIEIKSGLEPGDRISRIDVEAAK